MNRGGAEAARDRSHLARQDVVRPLDRRGNSDIAVCALWPAAQAATDIGLSKRGQGITRRKQVPPGGGDVREVLVQKDAGPHRLPWRSTASSFLLSAEISRKIGDVEQWIAKG